MLALAFLSANIWKYIPNEKNKPIGTKKYTELKSIGCQKLNAIIEVTIIPTKEE